MNRTNVDYDKKQIISNIFTLTNVATDESLSFIPSDSEGNFNYRGISMTPIMRNAMQTTQTAGEWTDLEYPWMAIPQEDWTGGRANLRFTIDKSRYYDSYRAQSAFNSVIFNAPLDYYSTGYRKAETNWPGNVHWKELRNKTFTASITPTQNISAHNIYLLLKSRGNPEDALKVKIYKTSDNTATSDEIEINPNEIELISKFHRVSFETDFSMTAGTQYTLEVSCDGGSMKDHYEIGMTGTNIISEPYYRLTEVDTDKQAKFFQYEQLEFMVRQQPNGSPSLWMNGDIAKATSATSTTIKSTGKSWATNQWKGARVGLVYRHGIEGQVSVWKTIVSNTSNTLTVDSAWDVNPQSGTVFIIVDTPIWTEVTGHGLTSAVTDVHVIRGAVYFCQGDYVHMRKMRWNNGSFEWMELTSNATFLQSVRDTSGLMLYRGRNDDDSHLRSVERARLLDWQPVVSGAPDYSATKDYLEGDIVKHSDKLWRFAADKEAGEWDSRYVTEIIFPPEPETDPMSSAVIWEPSYIPADEPEGILMAIQSTAINPNAPVITPTIDFGSADFDAKNYVIDICKFEAPFSDTTLTITLQESADGYFYTDVQTATATTVGRWYMTAKCNYRYRRLKLAVSGTGQVAHIRVKTSQMPWFVDKITLLDNYGKLTRLFEYGAEQEKSLWVFQEGMVSSVNKTGGTYHLDRINIDELATTAEEWNGKAVATSDVYLIWSWLNGLQRYYNTQLEGKGPDHDEGLPHNMRGRITQILSYPSNFFASVDGGEDGYSSVFLFNGSGWHNLYTASNPGERIFDIAFQPIYGNRPDRLWIQIGSDIIWLAMPSKILYAPQDPNAEYTHESVLVSAWITGGMAEVKKLWQSLSILADNLEPGVCWIEADYQLDNEDHPWMPIPTNPYETSPQEEKLLASSNESVNGYRLRYRLRLQSTDIHKTPKVNVVLLKAIGIIEIKYSIGFTARNIKYKPDLMGEYEELEPLEVFTVLDNWARNLYTLRLNSAYRLFDGRKVFLEAPQTSVLNEKSEGYLQQITMTEI